MPQHKCSHGYHIPEDLRDQTNRQSPYCSLCWLDGCQHIAAFGSPTLTPKQLRTAKRQGGRIAVPGIDADDMRSEAVLAALEVVSRRPDAEDVLLIVAVRNALLNICREHSAKKRGHGIQAISLDEPVTLDDHDTSMHELVPDTSAQSPLAVAIDNEVLGRIPALPEPERTVVTLHLEGFSMVEIGKKLTRDKANVSRRFHHACELLAGRAA